MNEVSQNQNTGKNLTATDTLALSIPERIQLVEDPAKAGGYNCCRN